MRKYAWSYKELMNWIFHDVRGDYVSDPDIIQWIARLLNASTPHTMWPDSWIYKEKFFICDEGIEFMRVIQLIFLDMCKWPKNFMKTPEEIQTGCVVDEFYFLFFEILLFTMSIDKDSKCFLDF